MTILQPHQQRVVAERDDLAAKLKALTTFIDLNATFASLPRREQELLQQQEALMRNYVTVLTQRINGFMQLTPEKAPEKAPEKGAARYRKKPVEIEAVQWTGENLDEVLGFMSWRNASHDERSGLAIHTLEGNHSASPGDFIIKGIAGEFYPCKPEIFTRTYDLVGATGGAA